VKRHHVLPATLLVIAVCSIIAAATLGSTPPERGPSGVVGSTSTAVTEGVAPGVTTSSAPAPVAEPGGVGGLLASLDSVWAQTRRPSTSCLMVQSGSKVVYERNPDLLVTPASTMKLLTATAVLQQIPATDRLRTPVVTNAAVHDGIVDGDVTLVGGGDPVLGTVDWAAHFERQPRLFTPIERLADDLVASGIHEIRGRVVGDDGRYDRVRYVPRWPRRYIDDNETGPLSALTVNDGFASWDGPDPEDIPWDDPPRDAAAVLTALLRARGIAVDGEPAAGAAAPGSRELAAVESPTIGALVTAMLQDSDNGTAELLLKELGLRTQHVGSSDAGAGAVRVILTSLGMPMRGVAVHDGSGLDRGDHVTCRLLVALLQHAAVDGPIRRGLPIAAQTGTLAKRFLGTPVAGHLRAKTGSITGVAALAGFADSREGRLTFANILNGIGTYADARRVQDALGAALVGL
jgi:D-alanyl-D-alanine carboxypeptidase/D-alanyl-D-alanine-endopeptidase (penicillin-binding protein 4)